MNSHRWMRVRYSCIEIQSNPLPRHMLNAIRDDGQQFVSFIFTDGENVDAIKRDLWGKLNTHIDDPAMPPTVEDGVEWSSQVSPDSCKGYPGWEEMSDE